MTWLIYIGEWLAGCAALLGVCTACWLVCDWASPLRLWISRKTEKPLVFPEEWVNERVS